MFVSKGWIFGAQPPIDSTKFVQTSFNVCSFVRSFILDHYGIYPLAFNVAGQRSDRLHPRGV